jgi:exonuclease III
MVMATQATIVCIQETKLQVFDERLVNESLGQSFRENFSFLPATGTCGGILIAVSESHFRLVSSYRTRNTLTVRIHMLNDGVEWSLMGVYGPQLEVDKIAFLDELKDLRSNIHGEWLISGDFNLIYKAEDKNNSRLNRRLMGKFKVALDDLELRELPLHGRKFTWSSSHNSQNGVTMTRIDRMFCSTAWEEMFPTAHLQAWASTISDHCPLILQGETERFKFKGFRFEAYWLGLPGFKDVVKEDWDKPLQAIDSTQRLHIKLSRTAKAFKKWEKMSIGNIKTKLAVAKEVIWLLDQA